MSDLYEIVGLTIEQVAACVEALLGMDADHAVVRRVRQSLETSPAPDYRVEIKLKRRRTSESEPDG